MSDEKKLPKRRFKEFLNTPSWEQRKLGQCSVIITGGTPSTRILEYWSPKEIPWMSSGEINKKRISKTDDKISKLGLEQSSARWVKKNSILIALAGQGKTRGTVAINGIDLTTNQSIAAIELDSVFNTEFVFQNLDSRYDELRKESSGDGTRGGLNKKIISDLYIPYTEYKEQDSIGDFFKKLDNLITLHQRKLNKLENLKKAYLEELFPDGKQCKPKRRFKEFKEDWEQRKLGEVAKVEMDKRIYKEQTTAEGEIPFYKIGTFGGKADSYISEELYNEYTQKYSHPKEGDILISASGSIGRTVVYHGEKAYFQDSNIVWLNHKGALDNGFLLQFYSRVQWAGLEGSTIKRLYNKNILETEINVPNIEEQKNIGKFFTQVDNLITLHQRKLKKLKNLKEAYLRELFV